MSFLLQPDIPPTRAAQITLLLSVAMCRTLRKETGLPAEIKWPNDILIRGRKVCGILIETILEADRVKMMIAGIGMNVNTVRSEFPADLSDSVTSLMEEAGRMFSREELIGAFFEQLAHLYDLFRSEGFAPIKTLWEALTVTLGKRVRVAGPHGLVEGIAENITDEGALMVRDDNGRLTALYSGDLAAAPRG